MKKKVLSLLLAVVMTFSLAVTANAAEETAQDLDGDIVILHTNDVHGAISGYAKVAALKDAYEARGAYVLLMDAADSNVHQGYGERRIWQTASPYAA